MHDFLLELSRNPIAKNLVSSLGLPVPQPLRRSSEPWEEHPLDKRDVVVGGGGDLHPHLAEALARMGASVHVAGDLLDHYSGPAEAYSRTAVTLEESETPTKKQALVYDATGLQGPEDLRLLHEFFRFLIRSIAPNGRVAILHRPPSEGQTASQAAAHRALEGLARSIAKEVGRKGATAQAIAVAAGAESRLEGPLRFFLTCRSAYVSGQTLAISRALPAPEKLVATRCLEGKTALVTGAARGIGAATAQVLAREGAFVVGLDRPADDGPLSKTMSQIGGASLLQDITDADAPQKIAEFLKKERGGVDIVVHNAGITRDKTLGKMDEALWGMTVDINLGAVIRITEALMADKTLAEGGRIVCLSSIAGIAGNFGQTNYATAKAGIIGYVQHMAPELAAKNIAINAIAPGFIETRLTAAIPFMTREVARRLCNLSQGGQPVDVAEAIAFMSSPGAHGVTGNVLRVCGGNLVGA